MWVNEIPNIKFINVPKLGCIAINLKSQITAPVFIRLRLSRSPYLPLYRRPQAIASNSIAGIALTRGPLVALHLQHTSSPPVASLHLSTFHLLEAQSHQQHSQGEDQIVDHESTITLWLNNKFLKNKKRTCDIKRMSRLKMQEPHVTGTKSFARLAEEEATKNDDVYPSRGEIFRIPHTRKDGSIVNENVATILSSLKDVPSDSTNTQGTESEKDTSSSSSTESQIVQQQNANPLIRTPKVPPSPIPTGNYNVSPEQLASMTRDHDMSALQNFDGVKGLSEMLKTNPDKGIDDDESNILDRKNVFGSNTYSRKKGRSFWRFLLDACRDTTLIILMVAAAASLALGIKTEVPADGVLISGHSLSIDESSMTGESKIATSVGIHTEWGLLMASISEDNDEETPLQVRLNGVATFIGIVGLVVAVSVLVILLVRFFTGHTEDDEERIEFIAGKTSVGDAVDGAIKIFTVAVCIYYLLST
ncbi:hypothetical protein LXL04_007108 [Taraxacum kok-saghyz]